MTTKSESVGFHAHAFVSDSDGNTDKCLCGEKKAHMHTWTATELTNRFGGVLKCIGQTERDSGCTAVMTIHVEGFERWSGEWSPDSHKRPGVISTQDPFACLDGSRT